MRETLDGWWEEEFLWRSGRESQREGQLWARGDGTKLDCFEVGYCLFVGVGAKWEPDIYCVNGYVVLSIRCVLDIPYSCYFS